MPLVRAAVKSAVKIASSCYNNLVVIEEKNIQPTNDRAQACVRVCQMLSNCYRDIELFRFDGQLNVVFIFANEDLQIVVYPNGEWSFIDAA